MRFTETHEWVELEGKVATIGISDFIQKKLGEIVHVELPSLKEIHVGDDLLVLESSKAAVDIYSPISGKIVAINEKLKDEPNLVNSSSEKDGWFVKIEMANIKEFDKLMTKEQYLSSLSS